MGGRQAELILTLAENRFFRFPHKKFILRGVTPDFFRIFLRIFAGINRP
jgi:hypothetical protein